MAQVLTDAPTAAFQAVDNEGEQQLASFMTTVITVTSTALTGFYVYQRFQNRCNWPVIYVASVTVLIYAANLLSGSSLTWVPVNGDTQAPLGRYFSWLVTCPVIIMQLMKLHETVGLKRAQGQEKIMVVLDQCMIVCGAYAAVSEGVQKWIFFFLSVSAGSALFASIWSITSRNFRNFPGESRKFILVVTAIFFTSWLSYPALWLLGEPGLRFLSVPLDNFAHVIADLISKNLFGLLAWYVRWIYLDNKELMSKSLKLKASNIAGEQGNLDLRYLPGVTHLRNTYLKIEEEEYHSALSSPLHIIVMDTSVLVQKAYALMMSKANVKVTVAFKADEVRSQLKMNPLSTFDAVIVVPKHYSKPKELATLRDLSIHLCSKPHRIPMLGVHFDLENHEQGAGHFIHGILPRPLDQNAIKTELVKWRLTSFIWRKVSTSVIAIKHQHSKAIVPTANNPFDPIPMSGTKVEPNANQPGSPRDQLVPLHLDPTYKIQSTAVSTDYLKSNPTYDLDSDSSDDSSVSHENASIDDELDPNRKGHNPTAPPTSPGTGRSKNSFF